ncbi:cysteine proteinase [Mytilinidion resinicola]|uniref:Cysteine proteinase n=1 Tax=Mytilinidion resinicola TaxID=574789 RepID=A0A6A6Z6I5_9PEZI|nr:cysteine proteinase [Mytilinidion resinicola]KAF2816283.1 cysteine proteinase [Mytilinidion resinicola]
MRSATEFPQLAGFGLYASKIRGDGNCLFNALSDQLYGDQSEHREIRAKVIAYMRDHADVYKSFITVNVGGGTRRNPKRKNTAAVNAPLDNTAPTDEQIHATFEEHLRAMARGGTYGDNLEITAFSSAFRVDVKIYQREFAYMVHGEVHGENANEPEGQRPVVHIAYHTWEHFSSVRNINGPHTGLPNVQMIELTKEEEKTQQTKLATTPYDQPWMLEAVSTSLPFLADERTIKKALEEAKGNVNNAISSLIDAKSCSASPGGSSVERDTDTDTEDTDGPNKRRDRRLSRATRTLKTKAPKPPHPFLVRLHANSSQESLTSDTGSYGLPLADPASPDNSDSDSKPDWHMESFYQGDYNSPTVPDSQRIPSRVKINLKKPQSPSGRKTVQRQTGPQRRKAPSAREKKDIKKHAQKAARKERAIAEAKGLSPSTVKKGMSATTQTKKPSPGLDDGFKILYI